MTEPSKNTSLDSVSVVGSVDASDEVTREDLLRELAAPSCIKKLPKIQISSRKGDVPDTVKKTFYLGQPQTKKPSPLQEPPQKQVQEPPKVEEPQQYDLPGPEDLSIPTKEDEPAQEESKTETIKPAVETDQEVILSVSKEEPSIENKARIDLHDNFEVDIETEVRLGFNPYSDLCSSLGFLIQGIHEELRGLEEGNYKFQLHVEKEHEKKA